MRVIGKMIMTFASVHKVPILLGKEGKLQLVSGGDLETCGSAHAVGQPLVLDVGGC